MPHHVEHHSPSGAIGYYARLFVRVLQLILSVAVIGLYAQDLDQARKHGVGADSKWVYAVSVGTLGAVGAVIFALPKVRFYLLWPLDIVVFALYIGLFAVFGKLFLEYTPTPEQHGQWRMVRAVWVDFTNAVLWLLTACYGFWIRVSLLRAAKRGKGSPEDDEMGPVGREHMGRHTGQDKI